MNRTPRSIKLAALVAIGTLVVAACGDDGGSSTTTAIVNAGTTTVAPATTVAPVETTAPSAETTVAPVTEAPTTVAAAGGGTITYAAEQEYTSYNNAAADQGLFANTLVLNLVQPGPFISLPDLTFKLWDDMMVSAELTSTDPQIVTYTVKDTAVWADGEPIDCDDFYLAWFSQNGKAGNRQKDGADELDADGNPIPVFRAASTTGTDQISSVTCDATGRVITATFDSPFADWKALLGNQIPAHIVEAKSGVADLTAALSPEDTLKVADVWNDGFTVASGGGTDKTVGLSGSWYEISEFNAGQNVILTRNEKFFGKPGLADSIVLLLVPDAASEPQALENGDVQVISPQPNPDLLAQLQGIAGVTTSVNQGVTFEHYDLNLKNVHLAKLEVRQAFALCLDREEIVTTLVKPLNPDATVLNNRIFVPGSPYYQDNMGEFATRDIEKSKALLTAAGYTFGEDGIAVSADGDRLTLRLGRRDPNPRRQSNNTLAIEQCKEAGFELTDDPAEDFNSVRLPASDYDVALFAWVASAALSSTNSIYLPPDDGGGQNWNSWVEPKVRELADKANVEFDDAARGAIYNEMDALVSANMVTIPLFQFQDLVAYSDTVAGVVYNGPLGVTWNANEWALTI